METITFTKTPGSGWPDEPHCRGRRGDRLTFPIGQLASRCVASWRDMADGEEKDAALPAEGLRDEWEILRERRGEGWFGRFGDRAADTEREADESFLGRLARQAEGMDRAGLVAWFIETNDPASIAGYAVDGRRRHGQ